MGPGVRNNVRIFPPSIVREYLDEQAVIKSELQRMEDSAETTEEQDGDFRDTLISRWEALEEKVKPIVERMERIRSITRLADDDAHLEQV